MKGFRLKGDEIPKSIVGALTLRHFVVGFRLDGMDEIGEFNGVLNEKDGRVVADQVEVAFLGIEFD